MSDEADTYRRTTAAARPAPAVAGRKPGALSPRGLASLLRRRLRLFAGTFVVVLLLGLGFVALRTPLYRASAEVVSAAAAGGQADAEVRLIRSPAMARDVALALGLDRDAAFARPAGSGPAGRLRHLLGAERGGAAPAPPGQRLALAVARLTEGVSVTRPAETVSLLIGYTAPSPDIAARVANEYARQYARRQLESAAAADRSGARILSEAEPPLQPVAPHPALILLAAVLLGLILGALVAVVRERRFRGITSGGEVEARTGLHHLGTVPVVASVLKNAGSPIDAVVASPRSGFAEAFRSLRTAIRIAGGEHAQVIAITSAGAAEGKTTVAVCLARTIALGGESVVLIDCDPAGRGASFILAAETRPGLAEVIAGAATLDEALVRDEASGARLLPPGAIGSGKPEAPFGDGIDGVIAELRERFAHVLIDAPAIGRDAAPLAGLPADLFVLAVRWRATADRAVREAAAALAAADGRVGGVALTQVDMRRQVKYVHDDESNYYAKLSKYYS